MTAPTLHLSEINGAQLELFDQGTGDPVMFIHGAGSVECHAILQVPELMHKHRLIHIHRRGYGRSEPRDGATSMSLEAADCRATLDSLGIERAHFVGESSGAVILLQYALDHPDTVQSIVLLEPALPSILHDVPEVNAALYRAGELFESGDATGAVDAFFREVAGPDYQRVMDQYLPSGWMDELAADMDTIALQESPAMDAWSFTQRDAARLTMPILNMVGTESRPYFHAAHETIKSWIPHAENVEVPETRHCMLEMNPFGIARYMMDFFVRHPIEQ
jgi:pimeloyl-ACP methyl ester carboxylesterase